MRHNAKRSSRGKPQKKTNGRMKVFDSNGPDDVRIRGTAWQVTEKYETLAKDAETSGNYVLAENYRQHAEHYQRIINSFAEETPVSADGNKSEDKKDENKGDKINAKQTQASKHEEREMAVA